MQTNPPQNRDVPRPFTSPPLHLDHFNLPPTVKQREELSERKLFLLPPNADQMTTSPSPSSLSEFKSSKMVTISSGSGTAGLCRMALDAFDYAGGRRDAGAAFHFYSQSHLQCSLPGA